MITTARASRATLRYQLQQLQSRIERTEARRAELAAELAEHDRRVEEAAARLEEAQASWTYRYKEPGLRKRDAWEHTWDLQRREDRGEKLDGPIPVPPKVHLGRLYEDRVQRSQVR